MPPRRIVLGEVVVANDRFRFAPVHPLDFEVAAGEEAEFLVHWRWVESSAAKETAHLAFKVELGGVHQRSEVKIEEEPLKKDAAAGILAAVHRVPRAGEAVGHFFLEGSTTAGPWVRDGRVKGVGHFAEKGSFRVRVKP